MGSGWDMNIVYAVTANYQQKMMPSLRSLLKHHPKARVFVITETDTMDAPVEVINITGQKWFPKNGPNYSSPYTYINLLKAAYPEILKVNKVIHLDADTIVADSLEPIWKADLKGRWIGAVPEYLGQYHPFGPMYYNMGVAVMNLAQMRKDKAVPELVGYLNEFKQPYADQDSFNYHGLKGDKFVPLDVRFNECFATGETDHPAIVHYCGRFDWYENPRIHRRKYLEEYL